MQPTHNISMVPGDIFRTFTFKSQGALLKTTDPAYRMAPSGCDVVHQRTVAKPGSLSVYLEGFRFSTPLSWAGQVIPLALI